MIDNFCFLIVSNSSHKPYVKSLVSTRYQRTQGEQNKRVHKKGELQNSQLQEQRHHIRKQEREPMEALGVRERKVRERKIHAAVLLQVTSSNTIHTSKHNVTKIKIYFHTTQVMILIKIDRLIN
jgi:hypothetical protein